MERTLASTSRSRIAIVYEHLWLHVALGTVGSFLLLSAVLVVMEAKQRGPFDWGNLVGAVLLGVVYSCIGATLAGFVRIPFLHWMLRQARRRQWPLAQLLLGSAVLFLVPILPVFFFGDIWQLVGKLSLALSLPFLVSYLVATYKLRHRIYAPLEEIG